MGSPFEDLKTLDDKCLGWYKDQLADGEWHSTEKLFEDLPGDLVDHRSTLPLAGAPADYVQMKVECRKLLTVTALKALKQSDEYKWQSVGFDEQVRLATHEPISGTPAQTVKPTRTTESLSHDDGSSSVAVPTEQSPSPVPASSIGTTEGAAGATVVPAEGVEDGTSTETESSTSSTVIKIDDEFAALVPPISAEQLRQLEQNLIDDRVCRDPLTIWKGKNILLDGHNRLTICKKHNISYSLREIELPDRNAAHDWIIRCQLGRRNMSELAYSDLRGRMYNRLKQSHGGARPGGSSDHNDNLGTADKLGKEFDRSRSSIIRDGKVNEGLEIVEKEAGREAKQKLLARSSNVTKKALEQLANVTPAERKPVVQAMLDKNRQQRSGDKKSPKDSQTAEKASATGRMITLPREPAALAEALVKELGRPKALKVQTALAGLLAAKAKTPK